jgi:hypothetical protein
VTIHEAQGLTVDRSIVVVDERTTAGGLYVGMSRGRPTTWFLAVCDRTESQHQGSSPTASAAEVMVGGHGPQRRRGGGPGGAAGGPGPLGVLATLAPRLANLDASIAKELPPDRSDQLRWAAQALDHARRTRSAGSAHPGRAGRRQLEEAQARYDPAPASRRHDARPGSTTTPTPWLTGRSWPAR